MSARPHPPIPLTALTPFALLPAVLSQADSFSESSMRLGQLVLKPPDDEGPQRYPYRAVSFLFPLSAIVHSPEPKTGSRPVSKPAFFQAYSCCPQSVERWWRARGKPPNIAVKAKRRLNNVVNTKFSLGALKHLPSVETALILPILSARLLRISSLGHPSIGLACPVRKPPNWIVCSQLLYEIVNTTSERKGIATNLSRPIDALNRDAPVISHPSRLRGCRLQMPSIASLSSSFARSCLWTA
ncbi:hypothetical protein F5887DRAFT_1080570 [Amanita rubescens]|nr:hypothetical protein F5887DRAFT_1080570 [Amanita rubescens]